MFRKCNPILFGAYKCNSYQRIVNAIYRQSFYSDDSEGHMTWAIRIVWSENVNKKVENGKSVEFTKIRKQIDKVV